MIFGKRNFVEIDVLLRRGGHIGRSDLILYDFICEHFTELKHFYSAYNCDLVQHPDGFFFLVTTGDIIQSRILSRSCMHLGMFIALRMRDPEITATLGRISISSLLSAMETSVPKETLQEVYAPKQREASQYEKIRGEILKSLKTLQRLRFLKIIDGVIVPLEAIHRFTDLARYDNDPDSLAKDVLRDRGVLTELPEDDGSPAEAGDDGEEAQCEQG